MIYKKVYYKIIPRKVARTSNLILCFQRFRSSTFRICRYMLTDSIVLFEVYRTVTSLNKGHSSISPFFHPYNNAYLPFLLMTGYSYRNNITSQIISIVIITIIIFLLLFPKKTANDDYCIDDDDNDNDVEDFPIVELQSRWWAPKAFVLREKEGLWETNKKIQNTKNFIISILVNGLYKKYPILAQSVLYKCMYNIHI